MANARSNNNGPQPQGGIVMPQGQPGLPAQFQLGEDQKKQLLALLDQVLSGLKQHKPILKSLQEMGVKTKVREVDGQECLVIPVQELMSKEYLHMSGVDMAAISKDD